MSGVAHPVLASTWEAQARENQEFKASLGSMRPCLKHKEESKQSKQRPEPLKLQSQFPFLEKAKFGCLRLGLGSKKICK